MHIADNESISASSLLEKTIEQALSHLLADQGTDGAWRNRFDTGVMADAQTVISLYLLGIDDSEWIDPLLQRIDKRQRVDGAWEVYPGDGGDLSTTVECYYAMELYQRWLHKPLRESAARNFITARGGLKKCRNLTKVFLAAGGEIRWSWLPSPKVYSWLFSRYSPVHIWDLVMFTRLHVPPMLLLSSMQYVSSAVKEPVLNGFSMNDEKIQRTSHEKTCERTLWTRTKDNIRDLKIGRKGIKCCIEFMLNEREQDGTLAGIIPPRSCCS